MSEELASRRERLRRPLPNPPLLADQLSTRGSSSSTSRGGGGGAGAAAAAAAAAAGVRGVVASRVAAMASAGSSSTTNTATNGSLESGGPPHKLTSSFSVDSNSSRIPSYRLSSLDRLAQRQRLFESGPGSTPPALSSGPLPPPAPNGTTPPSLTADPSSALVSSEEIDRQTERKVAGTE